MREFISKNIQETWEIANNFASLLKPGSVVCMTGDLGAGKTAFVQGIAKHFNIDDDIVSPTFNIALQYKNPSGLTLNHFDLYRLEDPQELEDIAFFEIIESGGISFIEWSEKFKQEMPADAINLVIEKIDENTRKIIWS